MRTGVAPAIAIFCNMEKTPRFLGFREKASEISLAIIVCADLDGWRTCGSLWEKFRQPAIGAKTTRQGPF